MATLVCFENTWILQSLFYVKLLLMCYLIDAKIPPAQTEENF